MIGKLCVKALALIAACVGSVLIDRGVKSFLDDKKTEDKLVKEAEAEAAKTEDDKKDSETDKKDDDGDKEDKSDDEK